MVKQVDQQIILWNKMIPQVTGEAGGNTDEDGDEVALKFLDGLLQSIAAVDVRGDKLELNFPIFYHDTFEFGANFIIEDLQVYCEDLGG